MGTPRSFPVVFVPHREARYFVSCPAIPGCYSHGETVEECLVSIREAIELVVEDVRMCRK
jgi:predicted RNase H-like HicB family nuclease